MKSESGKDLRTDKPEASIHTTWIVSDPDAFEEDPGPTSALDRVLPRGLTYWEWYHLFFIVLGVDAKQRALAQDSDSNVRMLSFEEEVSAYPMLSRINDVYDDAVFDSEEVARLERECRRLSINVSDPLAARGLAKLLWICSEARSSGLSIYMMCS